MKGGDHVAVGVERELDAGVTQPLGYDLGMDARLEQEGAVALCALTRRDGAEGDTFGISVAIDEDTAVVGAYLDGRATLREILPLTRELHHRLS